MRWVCKASDRDLKAIQRYVDKRHAFKMDAVLTNGYVCRGRYQNGEKAIRGTTEDWNYYGRKRGDGKGEGEP